jgi:diguanylate cyclase (GGDEF)-like protein
VFPCAPQGSIARRLVEAHVPAFVEDAQQVIDGRRWAEKMAHDSGVDPLTGLLERSAMGRLMARLQEGDLLIAIDLDDFKKVNHEDGRAAGDAVLRAFARALRQATRANENCARMRSDEFLVVLYQADADETAMIFLDRLRRRWREMATSLPAFSAGIAQVGAGGWRPAMLAADRALQRAKADPAGFWVTASEDDYDA